VSDPTGSGFTTLVGTTIPESLNRISVKIRLFLTLEVSVADSDPCIIFGEPYPHQIEKPDPDPHQIQKPDANPDTHHSQNSGIVVAQKSK
jgi:hypothetical protein